MGENKDYIVTPAGGGSINISEEVIAVIASAAAIEVEGVSALSTNQGKELAELTRKKNLYKGIKIHMEEQSVVIDCFIVVKYDYVIKDVAKEVQSAVVGAIESMTGLSVPAVHVHVTGVAFEREK